VTFHPPPEPSVLRFENSLVRPLIEVSKSSKNDFSDTTGMLDKFTVPSREIMVISYPQITNLEMPRKNAYYIDRTVSRFQSGFVPAREGFPSMGGLYRDNLFENQK
jgi:hypothetical protein